MNPPSSSEFKKLVGPEMYESWVKMIRALAPHGRTHRISPLVAAMLEYGFVQSKNNIGEETALYHSFARALEDLQGDAQDLRPLVENLFQDAEVNPNRTTSRGRPYSITDQALEIFLSWDAMPWE